MRGRGIVGLCEDEGLLDCAKTRACWIVRSIVGLGEGVLDFTRNCWIVRGIEGRIVFLRIY